MKNIIDGIGLGSDSCGSPQGTTKSLPAGNRIHSQQGGFTIAELLVAAAILVMLVALLLNMVTQTSKTWKSTSGKIEQFRDARDAFDSITRRLGQATLNTYLDYNNPTNPTAFMRQSQLRFLSGPTETILAPLSLTNSNPTMAIFFQAPNGFATNSSNSILQNALNTWGYFIEYASDTNNRPSFLPVGAPLPRLRYRLMELMEPTENFSVYNYTSGQNNYTNIDWISNSLSLPFTNRPVHVVAENVVAMILLPHLSPTDYSKTNSYAPSGYTNSSLASNYIYDSSQNLNTNPIDPNLDTHNQLPPVVQVTLIAVDETSAIRFPTLYANLGSYIAANNYFVNATNFTTDLSNFQSYLSSHQFNYRVFTTDVMIKGAKWSGAETN